MSDTTSESSASEGAEEAPRIFGRRHERGTPTVETRDFRGAPRPGLAERKELEDLAARIGKRIERGIGNYLRQVARVESVAPEVLEYQEAVRGFSEKDWIVPLLADGGDRGVLRIDDALQNMLLTRVLGGGPVPKTEGQPDAAPEEEFFEYETALSIEVGMISRAALKPLVRAILREWNLQLRESKPPYALDTARETLPAARQLRSSDVVIAFESELYLGTDHGRIQLLLQASSLAEMLNSAASERNVKAPVDPKTRRGMESVVRSIDVGMAVVLGGASIELKDYMKLGVGDVMILDRKVGEPLRVLAGDAGEFTGQPGRIGNKIAVRILERLDSETSS